MPNKKSNLFMLRSTEITGMKKGKTNPHFPLLAHRTEVSKQRERVCERRDLRLDYQSKHGRNSKTRSSLTERISYSPAPENFLDKTTPVFGSMKNLPSSFPSSML